jgi:hypothetical protein
MFGLIYDLYQNGRISDARIKAESAQRGAQNAQTRIAELERKVDLLLLTSEALWTIIKGGQNISDQDLIDKIKFIDLQDGKPDGKVAKGSSQKCPECGKKAQSSSGKCLYCGHYVGRAPFDH